MENKNGKLKVWKNMQVYSKFQLKKICKKKIVNKIKKNKKNTVLDKSLLNYITLLGLLV